MVSYQKHFRDDSVINPRSIEFLPLANRGADALGIGIRAREPFTTHSQRGDKT